MLKKTKLVFILLLTFAAGLSQAALPKYPQVIEWGGQVWVTGKDGKRAELKSKIVLREKALLETSLAGFVKVQLDENRHFLVLGTSEVSLPVIGLERGEAPILLLKSGSFRWQQTGEGRPAYNIAIRSDLFEFLAPAGDFIFTMEPARAFAGVKVISGQMRFSALNGEDSVLVKANQQVGFQGVVEGGDIAYDVLLQGRKIPRGKLTAALPLDSKDLTQFAEEAKIREKAEKVKMAQQMKKQESIRMEGKICNNPPARFNECAWVCVGNPKNEKKKCLATQPGVSCVRTRCNANGDWADESALDAEKASTFCSAKPLVAPCDY
ncbi:hypothetical protein D3C87_1046010 [compost metagenome]